MPSVRKKKVGLYLKRLTDAEDDLETTVDGSLDLAGNELIVFFNQRSCLSCRWKWKSPRRTYLVRLLQDDTTLAVTDDGPVDLGVAQLLDGDLTGEGTVGLVEDVLGGDTDLGVGQLAGQGEVEGGGRDDDLGGLVQLGGVEVVDDGGDALGSAVPDEL